MLGNIKKSYLVAVIVLFVFLLVFVVFHLFSEYGPSSDKAMMRGCVEYIMEEYGSLNKGSETWSDYRGKEADLSLGNWSAVKLCNYFQKGDYEEEKEARKHVLAGTTYEIDSCEIYDKTAIVTVKINTAQYGVQIAKIYFEKQGGDWAVQADSVYVALMAGNGVGGTGNVISDIYDKLASDF